MNDDITESDTHPDEPEYITIPKEERHAGFIAGVLISILIIDIIVICLTWQ